VIQHNRAQGIEETRDMPQKTSPRELYNFRSLGPRHPNPNHRGLRVYLDHMLFQESKHWEILWGKGLGKVTCKDYQNQLTLEENQDWLQQSISNS
jgi:hypothetical protein